MVQDAQRIELMLKAAVQSAMASTLSWSAGEQRRADAARGALQKIGSSAPVLSIFESIRPLIPFAAGMIEVVSASRPKEPANLVYGVPEGFLSERARLIENDPSIPMVAQVPAGVALRGPDVIPPGEFQRLMYTQRMYTGFGLDNVTGMILSRGEGGPTPKTIVLWLFSGGNIPLPTWGECRLLDSACEEIRHALMRISLPLAAHQSIMLQIMQEQDTGYILLSSNGAMLEVNRRASLLSQKYLPRGCGAWRGQVHALIATAPRDIQRGAGGSYRIPSPDGSGALDVHVHRLAKESHALSEDVTLLQLKETLRSSAARKAGVLQRLPPRQRQVAALLADSSLSYKHIADELGMAEGTMRKHAERAYRALGVRSRFELIALAATDGGENPRRD